MEKNNIILITVDALREDHLKYFTKLLKRPNKIIFNNAFSNAPHTSYSVPSFLTSKYPPINNPQVNIAKLLKDEGYSNAAFVPNVQLLSPLCRRAGLSVGFDVFQTYLYDHRESRIRWLSEKISNFIWNKIRRNVKSAENIFNSSINALKKVYFPFNVWEPYPRAEIVCRDAINWMKNCDEPFFLWIHLMDVHWPYVPPDNYLKVDEKDMNSLNIKAHYLRNIWSEYDIKIARKLYKGEVEYVDHVIDNFINSLPKNVDSIILTADHGEEFFEHNKYGHELHSLYDEVLKVPFIILNNTLNIDHVKDIIREDLISLLDLSPTILSLSGTGKISKNFLGEDLTTKNSGLKRKYIIMVGNQHNKKIYAIRTEKYKLINKDDSWEFYNLETDPNEKNNIYADDKMEIKLLKTLLFEKIRNINF